MVCLLTGVPSAGIVVLVALLAVRGPEELVVAVLGVADLQVYILQHRGVGRLGLRVVRHQPPASRRHVRPREVLVRLRQANG